MTREDIYKKHAKNLLENNNKSPEWNTAFKKLYKLIWQEKIENIHKYKIMLALGKFDLFKNEGSEYKYITNSKRISAYVLYYNSLSSGLKNISIIFVPVE